MTTTKTTLPRFTCADCGETFANKKPQAYCSVCRPYHVHAYVKPDKSFREFLANNDRPLTTCGYCGLFEGNVIHDTANNHSARRIVA